MPPIDSRSIATVLATPIVLTVVFAIGTGTGLYFHPHVIGVSADDAHEDDHDEHEDEESDHEEHEHVALTKQAFQNLRLQLGTPQRGEYWRTQLVPAIVTEIPGRSHLFVSSPVEGVVERLHAMEGEAIHAGQAMFEIRLTDKSLIDAQSDLLATVAREIVAKQEIKRLAPLATSGAVSGVRKRELELELQQLKSQKNALIQRLEANGLPRSSIEDVMEEKGLLTSLTINAPAFEAPPTGAPIDNDLEPADLEELEISTAAEASRYSIETLLVHPGKVITRTEPLCSIAYHSELYVEGSAFQDDMITLQRIAAKGWHLQVEQVIQSAESGFDETPMPQSLPLLRVDNHVDADTQTVKFYASLKNRVERSSLIDGRRFEQWQFRPGQRLHLRLPIERWEDQVTLPADAVVVDGPNAYVFAEHEELEDAAPDAEPPSDENDPDAHEEIFIEFEPVSVHVLHRDDRTVVIADDGQLDSHATIALNGAYKLYLEMKMQASGGGGHHHHHDH